MDKVIFPVIVIGLTWLLLLLCGIDRQTTIFLSPVAAEIPVVASVLTGLAVFLIALRARPDTYRLERLKRDRYGAWLATLLLAGLACAGAGYFVVRGIIQVSAQHWTGDVVRLEGRISEVRRYGGKVFCRKRLWVEPRVGSPFSFCLRVSMKDGIGPDVEVGAKLTLQIKKTSLGSVVTGFELRTPGTAR
jgi:hypothetical protein